jgi:hypothetical protein
VIHQVLVQPEDSPRLPQTDYEQCEHPVLWKDGLDPTVKRGKVQRYRCPSCGRQIVEGADSLYSKRLRIGRDLARGLSVRAVARRCVVSRQCVRGVRRILEAAGHPCAVHHGGRPPLRSRGTIAAMSKPLKWGKDGELAEPAVKASVILRPQIHKRLTERAKEAGVSLSQYIANLLSEHLKVA